MIVLDVSFVMKLFTRDISINIFKSEEKFIAPDLFDYELSNALWKTAKSKGLENAEARRFFISVDALNIEKHKTDPMKLFGCAIESGLTAYDASYLLLAKRFRCSIATFDKELIKAAEKEGIEVIKAEA